ncbi:hypothetical protein SATMO3_21900 [Sporomusa aerivorans]
MSFTDLFKVRRDGQIPILNMLLMALLFAIFVYKLFID